MFLKNKQNDKANSWVTIYVKSLLKLTRVGDVNAVTTDMLLMIRAIAARAGSDPTQTWLTCLKLEFPGIATAAQTHSTEQTINTGTDLNFHMLCS